MTKKEILEALEDLPEDAKIEDAMERLYYLWKTERGLTDAESGRAMTQAEVIAQMSRQLLSQR